MLHNACMELVPATVACVNSFFFFLHSQRVIRMACQMPCGPSKHHLPTSPPQFQLHNAETLTNVHHTLQWQPTVSNLHIFTVNSLHIF